MQDRIRLLLAVFISLLALSVNAFAQRNMITGTVTNTARQPVSDLWVELLNDVDSVLKRTRTDSTGRYSFQGLSFGTFRSDLSPPEHPTARRRCGLN